VRAQDADVEAVLIDPVSALLTWGEQRAYAQYLEHFVQHHVSAVSDWRDGDAQAVSRGAHKLCGGALNLSLPRLAEAARVLEKDANDGAATGAALADLDRVLADTLAAIDAYLAGIERPAPAAAEAVREAGPAIPPDTLVDRLTAMLPAIEANEPDAIEQDLARIAAHLPAEDVAAVQRAIDAFDFRQVEDIVRRLIQTQAIT